MHLGFRPRLKARPSLVDLLVQSERRQSTTTGIDTSTPVSEVEEGATTTSPLLSELVQIASQLPLPDTPEEQILSPSGPTSPSITSSPQITPASTFQQPTRELPRNSISPPKMAPVSLASRISPRIRSVRPLAPQNDDETDGRLAQCRNKRRMAPKMVISLVRAPPTVFLLSCHRLSKANKSYLQAARSSPYPGAYRAPSTLARAITDTIQPRCGRRGYDWCCYVRIGMKNTAGLLENDQERLTSCR